MAVLEIPWVVQLIEIVVILVTGLTLRYIILRVIRKLVKDAVRQKQMRNRFRRRAVAFTTAWAGERGEQRASALGSLASSITTVVIGLSMVISVLGVLGVNLTPILASAGVVGVALGFGAQNLIKDLIAGVGFLVEDQLGIGDVVDMEKASGTVETVGLRVTRLRDPHGVIWYVRNGEVLRIGNKSQGWAEITFLVEVAYDTDLDRAEEILARVARETAADPGMAALIIDPPRVLGVERVTANGVTLKVIGTCLTDKNGNVERELRTQTKIAFDAEGIALAPVPTFGAEPAAK